MNVLHKLLKAIALLPVALVLVFEEWGWEPLARLMARLSALPLWAYLERKIAGLGRWPALMVFGVPVLLLFPVKLLALYLFAQGDAAWGLVLLVATKLAGTAILARLFQLTQPALMHFGLFARWYPRWVSWKANLLVDLRHSFVWRLVRAAKFVVKGWLGR